MINSLKKFFQSPMRTCNEASVPLIWYFDGALITYHRILEHKILKLTHHMRFRLYTGHDIGSILVGPLFK